jgi:hypothetical protein
MSRGGRVPEFINRMDGDKDLADAGSRAYSCQPRWSRRVGHAIIHSKVITNAADPSLRLWGV